MAYEGYLCLDGTEILNAARTRAYMAELVPGLSMPRDWWCENCDETLHLSLGDKPYATPLADTAPWVDSDNPDTWSFAGLFPLEVTGLSDDTRTATVTEIVGNGGFVAGQRKATREIRVSALAMGADEAAVEAGLSWLRQALDGNCEPGCGANGMLQFLSACPPVDNLGAFVTSPVDLAGVTSSPASAWNTVTHVFTPADSTGFLSSPVVDSHDLPCDPITWTWQVLAPEGTVITLSVYSEDGLVRTDDFTSAGDTMSISIDDFNQPEQFAYSTLAITGGVLFSGYGGTEVATMSDTSGSPVSGTFEAGVTPPGDTTQTTWETGEYRIATILGLTWTHRIPGDPGECAIPYIRHLHGVAAVEGPTVTQTYRLTAGAMRRIEFLLVATVPHLNGADMAVGTWEYGVGYTAAMEGSFLDTTGSPPLCDVETDVVVIADPDCDPLPAPPRPAIPDIACAPEPDYRNSYSIFIPESAVPGWQSIVPDLRLSSGGTAVRSVRIRMMERPLPTQRPTDLDPCNACGSFVVDYIPPNATFEIDGLSQRVTIHLPGDVEAVGNHLLSGLGANNLFEWPELSCGLGYYMVVDVAPDALTRIELSVALRE